MALLRVFDADPILFNRAWTTALRLVNPEWAVAGVMKLPTAAQLQMQVDRLLPQLQNGPKGSQGPPGSTNPKILRLSDEFCPVCTARMLVKGAQGKEKLHHPAVGCNQDAAPDVADRRFIP